jgi:16S rRNA (guanine527-N7)-methyltransferase
VTVTLIEPLARRTAYLAETVTSLDLTDRVLVVRSRAEEVAASASMFHVKPADVVASRAVAALDRLAGWSLPLARLGGLVIAMKGSSASEEIARHAKAVGRLGGSAPALRVYGADMLPEPTTVVEFIRLRAALPPSPAASTRIARRSTRF